MLKIFRVLFVCLILVVLIVPVAFNVVPINASKIVDIGISPVLQYEPGQEIVSARTENSKTYYLGGNSYAVDASIGAIHYKDNYADKQEQWKDIDLTFVNGQITTAPYILTVNQDDKSLAAYDKKTGKTTTVKLAKIGAKDIKTVAKKVASLSTGKVQWTQADTDLDLAITAGNTSVNFDWVVKSENAPHEVTFDIADGGIPITYQGKDANGKAVDVTTSKIGNKVTEKIAKGGSYPKTINPTLDFQVSASTDDVGVYWNGATWVLTSSASTYMVVGYVTTTEYKWGGGIRFTGITIPVGAVITTSYISFKSRLNLASNTVNSYITGGLENNPTTFSTLADYQARRGTVVGGADDTKITTAQVAWDSIGAWTINTWYNSPDISAVIQELVNAHAPTNEAETLFWDDHDNRSTPSTSVCRQGLSYDSTGNISGAKLHIEYVTAPSITAVAASNISTTSARLNAQITDDGGATSACQVSFGYGTTELLNVGTLANNTGTATGAPISLSGGFDDIRTTTVAITGAGTFNITLPAGVSGTATSGTATLVGSPVALAAGATTAIDSGATTGNITVAITNVYDTITAFSGTYSTNDFPYLDVAGLTQTTPYYYRVQVKNVHSTVTSTNEITFTTDTTVVNPTNIQAFPLSTSISLSWSKGSGASKTLIRVSTSAFPTTTAEGTSIYLDTGVTYTHTGLAVGTTYYYSFWGEDATVYSASYVSIAMTTSATDSISSGLPTITNPNNFDITTPNETVLQNLGPFYDLTNGFIDSWGMGRGNAWAGIVAFIIVILSLIVYIKSGSISGALVVMVVCLVIGYFIGLVSGWWILFGILGMLGSFALPKREA